MKGFSGSYYAVSAPMVCRTDYLSPSLKQQRGDSVCAPAERYVYRKMLVLSSAPAERYVEGP